MKIEYSVTDSSGKLLEEGTAEFSNDHLFKKALVVELIVSEVCKFHGIEDSGLRVLYRVV